MALEQMIIKLVVLRPKEMPTYLMILSILEIGWMKHMAKALELLVLELVDLKAFSMKHLLVHVSKSMIKRNQLIESNLIKKDKPMSYSLKISWEIIKIFQMIKSKTQKTTRNINNTISKHNKQKNNKSKTKRKRLFPLPNKMYFQLKRKTKTAP